MSEPEARLSPELLERLQVISKLKPELRFPIKTIVRPKELTSKEQATIKRFNSEVLKANGIPKKFFPTANIECLVRDGFRTSEQIKTYLHPELSAFPDPTNMLDFDKAYEILLKAINQRKKIFITGDFDADGLTGVSNIVILLKKLGLKQNLDFAYYIPHRKNEGHGISTICKQKIYQFGAEVVITVDFGSSNYNELLEFENKGIESIVFDHHHVFENPGASAFCNPNQKGCGYADGLLSGSGVVLAFIKGFGIDIKEFLPLAAIGTVADMMEISGANRIIAKAGFLELWAETSKPITELRKAMKLPSKFKASSIGFQLAPALNSIGRMGLDSNLVVDFLTSNDEDFIKQTAQKIAEINRARKTLQTNTWYQALQDLNQKYQQIPSCIVLGSKDYDLGIIGLVAQNLAETYGVPAATYGIDQNNKYRFSIRAGNKTFNVINALEIAGKYCVGFGGHTGAGGSVVSQNNFNAFVTTFSSQCPIPVTPSIKCSITKNINEITKDLLDELGALEPTNKPTIIYVPNLRCHATEIFVDKHLKVTFEAYGQSIKGILFNRLEHPLLKVGNRVNIACELMLNVIHSSNPISLGIAEVEHA